MAPVLQPGAQLALVWRARLESHLGSFAVEPLRARTAVLDDRQALAGLGAVCALVRAALPERDPHPQLWQQTVALLDRIVAGPGWAGAYLRWEQGLLEAMGFGLDLARCAVSGQTQDLAFVSPRTGRAVGREAARGWEDRLLPLPACLRGHTEAATEAATGAELLLGLGVTGHFLARELPALRGGAAGGLPAARARLIALLSAAAGA
jgi:DNA repair protein RecO (recombination protein O)